MTTPDPDPELIPTGRIARMLGVTRQRVQVLARRGDFPAPAVDVLGVGRLWRRADIEQWIKEHRG